MKTQKDIHSPYVVVLGGNTVRKKLPPTALPERPEAKVFGVVPALKTMEEDLHRLGDEQQKKDVVKKFHFQISRIFSRKEEPHDVVEIQAQILGTQISQNNTPKTSVVSPVHPVEELDVVKAPIRSSYVTKYLRSIAKMDYLKSKLAVQLPRHAKIGIAVALLIMTVVFPLISRFTPKAQPKTPGRVVYDGTQALVAHVGKSIILPEGETPLVVVATADDIRRLNVPDAKPGNKILLYQNSGKIVIYDSEGDVVLGVVNRSQP